MHHSRAAVTKVSQSGMTFVKIIIKWKESLGLGAGSGLGRCETCSQLQNYRGQRRAGESGDQNKRLFLPQAVLQPEEIGGLLLSRDTMDRPTSERGTAARS